MKKRLLSVGTPILTAAAMLSLVLITLSISRSRSNATSSADQNASAGVRYDLHGFDAAHHADWGHWCETDTIRSNAACADEGLLHSELTTGTHRGASGVSLRLRYTATHTNTLASYYEHLDSSGAYIDLSHLDVYRFWVKGEGDTIDANTTFWVRFADSAWYSQTYTVTGVTSDWQEKTIDLEALKLTPGWKDINWHQMREITIIFENDRGDSGRAAHPVTGTLYFDLIGLTTPDSYLAFPDPLNNYVAQWGCWCETDIASSTAACDTQGLLASTVVTTVHHGDRGAALELTYAVTQTSSLASHYEHLHSGGAHASTSTYFDLSDMGEFRFWVKGKDNTIGANTTFWVRFADRDWHMGFYTVTGVTGDWQEEVINIETMRLAPGWQDIDWKQMREITVIFENNRGGSGRVADPLTGTLYLDDLAFVDVHTSVATDDEFLDLLERRSFQYFWEYADPTTGLVRETATQPAMSSIAAVGFGLTLMCPAVERGWVSHEEAYTRVLTILDSFYDDGDSGDMVVSGTHGLFYHFVDVHDGTPKLLDVDGVSTIDSALLMAGVLSVNQCFTEAEITTRATAIYEKAEWDWFFDPVSGTLTMCWTPYDEYPDQCWSGEGPRNLKQVWHWQGYNEAMILYLLAIGSPTHPISATAWISWTDTYRWGAYYGYPVLVHGPSSLFGHQYSHAWVDFRGQHDGYANYFQNSRYATIVHRAHCLDVWYPGLDVWGITSSHGPIAGTCSGKTYRVGIGYPPDTGNNDGTVAPTAAGGSIAFTPEESISTLRYMYENYHQRLWGLYGFKDSMNGACDPEWFDNDYIGIDVGAMGVMIENYRSGLVWDIFMRNDDIQTAMQGVGFRPDHSHMPSYFYYREAEEYDGLSGDGIQVEDHSKAWNGKTLQIDPGEEPDVGNQATYTFTLESGVSVPLVFEIRYSEGVGSPSDTIGVYLDGEAKGSFTTDYTASDWNSFRWDDERIDLGVVSPGTHTLTLQLTGSATNSHGVNLDVFRLYAFSVYLPLCSRALGPPNP
jgi:hypothetical protein